jgi:hypothetical protein
MIHKLDDTVAFAFTTVEGRQEVLGLLHDARDLRRERKSRAYVAITEAELGVPRPLYGSTRGDGSDEDKAWAAYNRQELLAMRAKLGTATSVLQAAGYAAADMPWRFSRKAGCSCGCSPGFIASHGPVHGRNPWHPIDVWVGAAA